MDGWMDRSSVDGSQTSTGHAPWVTILVFHLFFSANTTQYPSVSLRIEISQSSPTTRTFSFLSAYTYATPSQRASLAILVRRRLALDTLTSRLARPGGNDSFYQLQFIMVVRRIRHRLLVPPSVVSLVLRRASGWSRLVLASAGDVHPAAKRSLNDVDEAVQNDKLNLELHAVDARLKGPLQMK